MSSAAIRHRPVGEDRSAAAVRDTVAPGGRGSREASAQSGRHRSSLPLVSESLWLFIFTFYAVLYLYIHATNSHFPAAVTVAKSSPGQFVEERARKTLDDLTTFGSRPVGSHANEELTVDYLLNEIEEIRRTMDANAHRLDVDVQRVSGTFDLAFLGSFTSYYDNVNNIVVKLSPKQSSGHSLLVNCHYDTTFNTTGASDDTVSCCIMLEVLRVMSRERTSFMHNVIFIFNGAEENVLQASHGFITQHPWAKEIKAFVNLEAAGAGGRELLFQSGPEHPWLIGLYAEHAPHPFASIVGQEIFQSGLIPSDTDFRIYRDFGGLPGLDIAYISNGYVYHTAFDIPEMIPEGCIQRGGENLLAVVKAIVNSELLADPADYRHGHLIFFDFLGLFMVVYPARIGTILNVSVAITVLFRFMRKLLKKGQGFHGIRYLKQLVIAFLVMLSSCLLAFGSAIAVAFLMDATGNVMSWFSNTSLIFGLYFAPAILAVLATCVLAKNLLYKDVACKWDIEAVYFDVALYMFALLLLIMTYFDLGSAVMPLLVVVFPTVFRCLVLPYIQRKLHASHRRLLAAHFLGLIVPSLLCLSLIYGLFLMFIPIMGRAGDTTIPDIFVAGVAAATVAMLSIWQIGFTFVTRSVKNVTIALVGIFLLTLFLATCTPVGFPYHANPASPTRQRHIIHHIDRTFHNVSGDVTYSDAGILHIPFDRNGVRHLTSSVPLLSKSQPVTCEDLPYCGWPFYFPLLEFFNIGTLKYAPASKMELSSRTNLFVVERTQLEPNRQQIKLSITGPHHINIYISPKPGVELLRWSVGSGHPLPTATPSYVKRPNYFIFYSYGIEPKDPLELTIEFLTSAGFKSGEGYVDVALGGHYLTVDGKEPLTKDLRNYLALMPDWTVNIGWVASYENWVI